MKRSIQENHGSYTITLPREIANDLGLKRGDKMDFILEKNKTIRMVPVDSAKNSTQATSAPSAIGKGDTHE